MMGTASVLDLEVAALAVLSWVGQNLLLGSILAAGTWVLLKIFRRRVPPGLEMALWCVVLLRFVVPGGPGWSGSLADLCGRLVPPPGTVALELGTPTALADSGEPLPAGQVAAVRAPEALRWPGWATTVLAVYAAIVLVLAIGRWTGYRRFRAACLGLSEADDVTRRLVAEVCRQVGLRRAPGVRISDDRRAPFVMGIVRPLLILARRQLVRPDELETIVVHEVTHLRRGDMIVRCVQCVAGVLLFFWPVVAWVNRRIDRAREYACDEWALRRGRLTPGEYARLLFEAVCERRQERWSYTPACMAGHPSTIERRIDVILSHTSRPSRGGLGRLGVAVFVIAWSGFALAGAGEAGKGAKSKYDDTEEGMRQHAQVLFDTINKIPGGDINGDGQVTKEECWAFVTAIVLSHPEEFLKEYPWADENHDAQLDKDEAVYLARGDFDFQELNEKLAQKAQKVKESGDEQKMQEYKQKTVALHYATWHRILDRRAKFVAEASPPPSREFVRQVFDRQIKVVMANDDLQSCISGLKDLEQIKGEVSKARARLAGLEGDEKSKLEQKVTHMEQKAGELRAQLQQQISGKLAELEATGSAEQVTRYRDLLKKLEMLSM